MDQVLSVAIAGPGDLTDGVPALESIAVSEDLRKSIHSHPALLEEIYNAAESLFKT